MKKNIHSEDITSIIESHVFLPDRSLAERTRFLIALQLDKLDKLDLVVEDTAQEDQEL